MREWFLPYASADFISLTLSLRELGLGMIVGGLCLIPLCLVEIQTESHIAANALRHRQMGGDAVPGLPPSDFLLNRT